MTTQESWAGDILMDRDALFTFFENGGKGTPAMNSSSGGNESSNITLSQALDHPVSEDILDPSYGQEGCSSTFVDCSPFAVAQEEFVPISYSPKPNRGSRNLQQHSKPFHEAQRSEYSFDLSFAQPPLHELLSAGFRRMDQPCGRQAPSNERTLSFDLDRHEQNETLALHAKERGAVEEKDDDDDDMFISHARKYDEEKWNEYLQALLSFKSRWGHCCVPYRYKPNPALSRWVRRQRYQYKLKVEGKPGGITDSRVAMLENVGFAWSAHGQKWQKRLNELRAYCFENGNCNIPHNYEKNPELANWVKNQRRQRKLYQEGKPSNITKERIDALNTLGFTWEHR